MELTTEDFPSFLETMELFKAFYAFEGEQAVLFNKLTQEIKSISDSDSELSNEEKEIQFKKVLAEISREYFEEIDPNNVTQLEYIIFEISDAAGNERNKQCLESPETNQKIGELNAELRNLEEKGRKL